MTTITCPTCQRPVEWSAAASPWRPFCSERCKLIDLGDWINEKHAIPGEEMLPGSDDSVDLSDRTDDDDEPDGLLRH